VIDLRDLEVRRVSGEQTRRAGLGACEVQLGVNIKGDIRSAWRPDERFDDEFVGEEVVAGRGAVKFGAQGRLSLLAREIISRNLVASNALVEILKAAVISSEKRVLPAIGIVDVEIELAVLAAIRGNGSRTDRGNVVVVEEGQDLLGCICRVGYGACWATRTSVGEGLDVDIVRVGTGWWSWVCKADSCGGENEKSAAIHYDEGEVGSGNICDFLIGNV